MKDFGGLSRVLEGFKRVLKSLWGRVWRVFVCFQGFWRVFKSFRKVLVGFWRVLESLGGFLKDFGGFKRI